MIKIIDDLLTEEEIESVLLLEPVVENKKKLGDAKTYKRIYFYLVLPENIIEKINAGFGLQLDPTMELPMRWLQGDNPKHVDKDRNNQPWPTHLLYLTDNPGKLVMEKKEYEIKKGRGYIFAQGILHETRGTSGSPKLALVINERGDEITSFDRFL
jgi:hypothetical protein